MMKLLFWTVAAAWWSSNCCITVPNGVFVAATTSGEEHHHHHHHQYGEEEEDDLALVQDTIKASRGERDEVGVRDQWESKDHVGRKEDTRKPISDRVKGLLSTYRLRCDGCDEREAVAKINAFVLETRRQAEADALRKSWWENVVFFLTLLAAGVGGAYLYYLTNIAHGGGGGPQKLGGGSGVGVSQSKRLREIEEQRRRAAKKDEESKRMAALAKEAPTWRDNEEKEVWTPKQETQFAKALKAFGGVPAKARYTLIADKVDGKTRQECLMHHKLLQVIAKEEKGQQ